jgi:amino acid transporter
MFFVFSEDRLLPPILSKVHPKWRTPYVSLIISAVICIALIWTKSALFLLNTGLVGIFIIYFIQGIALISLPYVNPSLYKSAKFKPPIPVLWFMGGIVILSMGYFTFTTLPNVYLWVLIGGLIGTGIYWIGRSMGKKEGFDYEARMNQDLIEETD